MAGRDADLEHKAWRVVERALDDALAAPPDDRDAIDAGLRAAQFLVEHRMVAPTWSVAGEPSGECRLHVRVGPGAPVDAIRDAVQAGLAAIAAEYGVLEPPAEAAVDPELLGGEHRILLDDVVLDTGTDGASAEALGRRLHEVVARSLPELLTREETAELLNRARQRSPMVVQELVPNMLALGQLRQVLQHLLEEGVPIRRTTTILNALADNSVYTKDPRSLAEHVRTALGRSVYDALLTEDGVLRAFMLSPDAERAIQNAIQLNETGQVLMLDPSANQAIQENLADALGEHRDRVLDPVLLVPPKIRRHVRNLLVRNFAGIVVLSYSEIGPGIQVENLATIEVHRPGAPPPQARAPRPADEVGDVGDAQDWNW